MGISETDNVLRVGIFGTGLDTYWEQFAGLRERLEGYTAEVANRLERPGVDIVNAGLIDTVEKAFRAGDDFRRAGIDILLIHVATYTLSATVLPVARRAKVPVLVLNLAPEAAIDYRKFNALPDRTAMTAEWLAYCQACGVPEIANVFRRARIPFTEIAGVLHGDDIAWGEIQEWIEAAKVARVLENNRLGVMGHYYSGMLDIYSDLTEQCVTFGGHIEHIEVDELSALRELICESQIRERVAHFRAVFDVQPDCLAEELDRAARTSVALDQLVGKHRLGSMAYYYKGSGNPANEDTMSSIILGTSMLTARGIPVAGEYEIKNAQAMKILDAFGAGGSFTEYYAADFHDDVLLMGHDGPGHLAIAEGKIKVRPLRVYHGKAGQGLSVEMSVKHGDVTLLAIAEGADGRLKFLIAEGQSVPGPILEIGNTNSRYRFSLGVRQFMQKWNAQGPAHHCAIGIGHIAGKLQKLAELVGVEAVRVC
ncbi:MAG: arabinose isomerase [Bryobacteraceae bacterium]